MVDFQIELATIPIQVHAFFRETEIFCRDYLTTEKPLFEVTVTTEDLKNERIRNECQDAAEGGLQTTYSDKYLETLVLYRKIIEKLISYDILLLHGAVIAYQGQAYVFTAKSGVGKTTHLRYWLARIPNCHILNGDKPLLLFRDKKIYACGTPWMGKERYGCNEILPISGICLLERALENHIAAIPFHEAFPALLPQFYYESSTMELLSEIKLIQNIQNVNTYRLGCTQDSNAALVAFHGMISGESL